jgi:hypothetical protein
MLSPDIPEEDLSAVCLNFEYFKLRFKQILTQRLWAQVKADFKEASTAPDVVARKKLQTQTLAAIFETYFRVLKVCLEPPDERYITSIFSRKRKKCIDICFWKVSWLQTRF